MVVIEAVWDLRFVNLIMHYIVVFCGTVAIYYNKRHGKMRLNKNEITNLDNPHTVLEHRISIFNSAIYYSVTRYNSDTLKHV